MNTRLLRRIQRHILEEPRRMNMARWIESVALIKEEAKDDGVRPRALPPCGTAGCIAGWAVLLTQKPKLDELSKEDNEKFDQQEAELILELEYEVAQRLFHTNYWPIEFYTLAYKTKPRTKKYAQIVAARIDHFIRTKGEE